MTDTVWPSDPISNYWRRPTNITNFHWCKFVDEARVLELYTTKKALQPNTKRIFFGQIQSVKMNL
jgi:hypothetical protein